MKGSYQTDPRPSQALQLAVWAYKDRGNGHAKNVRRGTDEDERKEYWYEEHKAEVEKRKEKLEEDDACKISG